MTQKIILGIAAVAIVIATPTLAADAAVKAPRAAPPPVPAWTGCYVNGGVGYGMFRQDLHLVNGAGVVITQNQTSGGSGWFGTVGGGCDYQFNNSFVVGAFADYDFMDLHGEQDLIGAGTVGSEKESSAIAAGVRLGFLVTPQILVYLNGGWTSTRFGGVNLNTANGAPTVLSLPAHTFNGGFFGGGTEVAVPSVPGLYWRNEYRYAGYQSADLNFLANGAILPGTFVRESKNVQTITTSLVWKFH